MDTSDQTVLNESDRQDPNVKFFRSIISLPSLFQIVTSPCFQLFAPSVLDIESLPPLGVVVKGRLCARSSYWRDIGANTVVQDLIESGYKVPFFALPPCATFKNNQSALQHRAFVTTEVLELLRTGRVKEVPSAHIVNPLTVSECAGKLRLILDLHFLNSYVVHQKIKFDDWALMEQFVTFGSFLIKFDITQGYHHIDLCSAQQDYFGFSWKINGVEKTFVFTVLPFGLT